MKQQITDQLVVHLIEEAEYWKRESDRNKSTVRSQQYVIEEQKRRIERIKKHFDITDSMEAEMLVEPIKYTLFKDGEPFMEAEAGGQAEECEDEEE